MPKRTRGYFLTLKGAQKLQDAKREWESQHNAVCTEEKMRELTIPFKKDGLDVGTIRGIFNGDKRKDKTSISYLFSAFNLQLDADDLTSEPQACLPKLDPNFLGREEAIADLNNLVNRGEKVILIQEEGGIGKTRLAEKYFKTQGFDLVLELYMAKETENIKPVEGRIEQWLRKFQDEPGQDFDTTLDKLREPLRDGSRKIGVLIDNLEPALKNGLFRDASWRYADLLRMLASVQSVTLITSREPLYEPGIRAELYQLKELKEEDWKQYFDSYDIKISSPALGEMHHAYGGNAEAMYIFKGAIKDKKFRGDLEAYWEHNREDLLRNPTLRNLVKRQFFKLQEDNEPAHKLLCRLGYYRYQKFSCIPRTGLLCLLGDIEDKRTKERIIDDLEDCSLVKIRDEGYYLHPVIREEAREHLMSNEEFSDELLLLMMKREIDKFLALDEKDNKLQNFLTWVNQKSISVLELALGASVDVPAFYILGGSAAVRAFYFSLELSLARNYSLPADFGFARSFAFERAISVGADIELAECLAPCWAWGFSIFPSSYLPPRYNYKRFPEFELVRSLALALLLAAEFDRAFASALLLSLDIACACCQGSEVEQSLQQLKDQLPDPNKDREYFKRWWTDKSEIWTRDLRHLIIDNWNIGRDWQFSKQQIDLLKQYYELNKLLVDCLDSPSNEVREKIEGNLLLPKDEIERREAEGNSTSRS